MVNHFVWDRPFAQVSSLESMIPKEIISYMGNISGIDILDDLNNNVPEMIQLMNRYSRYPITYKIRNGTSNDEFFYIIMQNY